MKTEIHIDPDCREPRLILVTPELTPEQKRLLDTLSGAETIPGYRGQQLSPLDPAQIFRFYTENQHVLAETDHGSYLVRFRLYELEQRLGPRDFIRISQGELINLSLVRDFDLSFSGTIQVRLKNGTVTYVSRRYVKKIKAALGI